MEQIILESQISDILIDFAEYTNCSDDIDHSDIEGIAMAKAKEILKLIKESKS